MQSALHALRGREGHVVAQVVKTEFVVGAVDNVGGVGLFFFLVILAGGDHADAEAKKRIHRAHPLGVAARQVVVHGDDMHRLAAERVQISRQRRHQGFALAGFHLGDFSTVQNCAADNLHIKVAQLQSAPRRLAHHRKSLRH